MADENIKKSPTYIHGIGSSTAIDTAGEIVDLAGLDCSSLVGGAFNWEHKSDVPAQIVGKVLEYKKIFSEADCEKDEHKYFWDKCKTPFLYVMGRLFDDKKPSAQECAALFQDDAEHPDEPPMVGLSIEGSKVDKKGIIVTKSIARKVTITGAPANKTCVAELVAAEPTKADPDSIFKSEPSFTIELFGKSEKLAKATTNTHGKRSSTSGHEKGVHAPLIPGSATKENVGMSNMGYKVRNPNPKTDSPGDSRSPKSKSNRVLGEMKNIKPDLPKSEEMAKAQVPGSIHPPSAQVSAKPKPPSTGMKYGPMDAKPKDLGKEIGKTKSGKSVMSHAKPTDYKGFGAQEHQEAANLHMGHAEEGKGVPGASHFDTAKRHMALAGRGERQGAQTQAARQEAVKKPDLNTSRMGKSMSAGSGMAAPGNLTQGSALGKESLDKKMKKSNKIESAKKLDASSKMTARSNRRNEIPENWTLPTRAGGHVKEGEIDRAKAHHEQSLARMKDSPKPKLGKAEWLARAEQEYKTWTKREEFESFMAKSMPHLAKGEIQAIGQALALSKSVKNEKKLKKMMPADTNLHSFVEKKEKK